LVLVNLVFCGSVWADSDMPIQIWHATPDLALLHIRSIDNSVAPNSNINPKLNSHPTPSPESELVIPPRNKWSILNILHRKSEATIKACTEKISPSEPKVMRSKQFNFGNRTGVTTANYKVENEDGTPRIVGKINLSFPEGRTKRMDAVLTKVEACVKKIFYNNGIIFDVDFVKTAKKLPAGANNVDVISRVSSWGAQNSQTWSLFNYSAGGQIIKYTDDLLCAHISHEVAHIFTGLGEEYVADVRGRPFPSDSILNNGKVKPEAIVLYPRHVQRMLCGSQSRPGV
jgi:hypothetical protein